MALSYSGIKQYKVTNLKVWTLVIAAATAFLVYGVARGNTSNDAGGLGAVVLFYPLIIGGPIMAIVCGARAWYSFRKTPTTGGSVVLWAFLSLVNAAATGTLIVMILILNQISNTTGQ